MTLCLVACWHELCLFLGAIACKALYAACKVWLPLQHPSRAHGLCAMKLHRLSAHSLHYALGSSKALWPDVMRPLHCGWAVSTCSCASLQLGLVALDATDTRSLCIAGFVCVCYRCPSKGGMYKM